MKCVICKHGELVAATTTVTLNKSGAILVVKDVPALVCNNCGEEYIDEAVTKRLRETAEGAANSGVEVQVRSYAA